MRIVIAGHVDHGKSTLVGRLLHDTDSLPEGRLEQITQAATRRGMAFEWSFLMDALQAERDQNVTIDTSHIWFKSEKRDYVIIDAPGHCEFLKNMITGAASSDAALLVIDAREGVSEQSMRHGYLLHLLGVRQVGILINKMDAVDYDEAAYKKTDKAYRAYLKSIGVSPGFSIPISARAGDNIASLSPHMPWYKGPSVLEALDGFKPPVSLANLPLRLAVQDVYKFGERRIVAGRIESGSLNVGDDLLFSPTNQRAKIASIEAWGAGTPPLSATAGESIGITLAEQIFVERGYMASHVLDAPILTHSFRAQLFWLGAKPLAMGKRYKLRINTDEFAAEVHAIEQVVDTTTLETGKQETVERNQVARVVLRLRGIAAMDSFADNPRTGRFVLVEDYDVAGGGIIDLEGFSDQRIGTAEVKSKNITALDLRITPEQRAHMNGHTGGILWFTGLSGAGKSTLALELQQRLFAKGCQVYVLDGDNIRRGLNNDLGFSASNRSENIRRIGEVAALFAAAGFIVIVSFISPYREDRERARAAASELFSLVHIKADLKTCEQRDTKGLYKKARKGEIKDFTGISAPYEAPKDPDLLIDTDQHTVEEGVAVLMKYVTRQFIDPVTR
jgi:bifunctional enzyme CysN/CysC